MAPKLWAHEPDTFLGGTNKEISEKRSFFVNRSVPEIFQSKMTQYHQVPLIIHHLARHSSANWINSLFTSHFMSHAQYTWSSFERFMPFKVWVSWRLHFLNCKLALRTLQWIARIALPSHNLLSGLCLSAFLVFCLFTFLPIRHLVWSSIWCNMKAIIFKNGG